MKKEVETMNQNQAEMKNDIGAIKNILANLAQGLEHRSTD